MEPPNAAICVLVQRCEITSISANRRRRKGEDQEPKFRGVFHAPKGASRTAGKADPSATLGMTRVRPLGIVLSSSASGINPTQKHQSAWKYDPSAGGAILSPGMSSQAGGDPEPGHVIPSGRCHPERSRGIGFRPGQVPPANHKPTRNPSHARRSNRAVYFPARLRYGSRPNTATPLGVPTYTLPLTTIGVMNLLPLPNVSRPPLAWLLL